MTPKRRLQLLRRLCLAAPLLSAASVALLALTPIHGLMLQTLQAWAPALASFAEVAPALGWLLFTLGCSAITAFDLLTRLNPRRAYGATTVFVILNVVVTALIFYSHLFVLATCLVGYVIIFHR